jgi:hypothetical protein
MIKTNFMKNLIIKKTFLGLLFAIILFSCGESNTTFDEVEDNLTRGAVLRTIAIPNPTFNFLDTSSIWSVELEEQDAKNGALFQEIELFVRHTNSVTETTSAEVALKTISASTFSPGPNGLPRGTVSASFAEVLAALDLNPGDYFSADQFTIRLVVVLTDGRTYSDNASGGVTGGSFFSSPYSYSVQFACPLTDVDPLFTGTYEVTFDAWADYEEGDEIEVVADDTDPLSFRILSTNNPFIANPDTSYMLVTINPDDGSVTVSSNECFDYGPGFCLDVIGTGTVGTCTGDINLTLDFGGFTNNGFNLVKQ